MADVMPNYRVSQQKLRTEILQLRARIEGHKLALLELVDRRDTILVNWDAEELAIEKKRADLAAMEKAHGEVTEDEIEDAKTTSLDEAVVN